MTWKRELHPRIIVATARYENRLLSRLNYPQGSFESHVFFRTEHLRIHREFGPDHKIAVIGMKCSTEETQRNNKDGQRPQDCGVRDSQACQSQSNPSAGT